MMCISKAAARFTTSRPMLPRPITPSVFARSSVPMNLRFSHLPDFTEALALGMERASDSISATVCSATETALPPGVFITSTPAAVAEGRSTLSTPTPARPITRRFGAAASTCFIHRNGAAHDQRVGAGQVLRIFFRIGNNDFPSRLLLQQLHCCGSQRLGNQDSHVCV